MKNALKNGKKSVQNGNEGSLDQQANERMPKQQTGEPDSGAISRPRSPGMFITNDPKKLSELPSAEQIVNRKPLSSKGGLSSEFKPNLDGLMGSNPTLKRTSSTNIQRIEPKYTVTRTPSNMSLNPQQNFDQPDAQASNALTSSTDSRPSSNLPAGRTSIDEPPPAQASASQISLSRIPEMIEIASEREANIRNYEIEQFRNDEIDLKGQFNDLLSKMSTLQQTLADLEGRELEEVQQKRVEAENFERETRERIEQLQVRKEEVDREAARLDNRLKELKSLQRETQLSRNLNAKMRNEMGKCLRKIGKQYENGCRKYMKELQSMEIEANERRARDRDLLDQYKQKQSELAVLLEEKMILRKSLEERNQLEKLLGQNGISLLVASNANESQQQEVTN